MAADRPWKGRQQVHDQPVAQVVQAGSTWLHDDFPVMHIPWSMYEVAHTQHAQHARNTSVEIHTPVLRFSQISNVNTALSTRSTMVNASRLV